MYKLIFYVPTDSAAQVKKAIFSTGAGKIGNYSHCSWETQGVGQFMPLSGANPTLGRKNHLESVKELRVEILCLEDQVKSAIKEMKASHPYEEPAFEVVSVLNYKFE